MPTRRVRWPYRGGLLALLAVAPAGAAEPPQPQPAVPPPELLEFLVEWETGDGQWIDPAELESPDWPDGRRNEPGPKQEQDHE